MSFWTWTAFALATATLSCGGGDAARETPETGPASTHDAGLVRDAGHDSELFDARHDAGSLDARSECVLTRCLDAAPEDVARIDAPRTDAGSDAALEVDAAPGAITELAPLGVAP